MATSSLARLEDSVSETAGTSALRTANASPTIWASSSSETIGTPSTTFATVRLPCSIATCWRWPSRLMNSMPPSSTAWIPCALPFVKEYVRRSSRKWIRLVPVLRPKRIGKHENDQGGWAMTCSLRHAATACFQGSRRLHLGIHNQLF